MFSSRGDFLRVVLLDHTSDVSAPQYKHNLSVFRVTFSFHPHPSPPNTMPENGLLPSLNRNRDENLPDLGLFLSRHGLAILSSNSRQNAPKHSSSNSQEQHHEAARPSHTWVPHLNQSFFPPIDHEGKQVLPFQTSTHFKSRKCKQLKLD